MTTELCPDCGRPRSLLCDNVLGDDRCAEFTIARLRAELAEVKEQKAHYLSESLSLAHGAGRLCGIVDSLRAELASARELSEAERAVVEAVMVWIEGARVDPNFDPDFAATDAVDAACRALRVARSSVEPQPPTEGEELHL